MTTRPCCDDLTDESLYSEIDLLSELMLAADNAGAHLSDVEIDRALGLTGCARGEDAVA